MAELNQIENISQGHIFAKWDQVKLIVGGNKVTMVVDGMQTVPNLHVVATDFLTAHSASDQQATRRHCRSQALTNLGLVGKKIRCRRFGPDNHARRRTGRRRQRKVLA